MLLASANEAQAAVRTASVTGNWNNTATWGGQAVPTNADNITINAGITVTMNVAGSCTVITSMGNGASIIGSSTLTLQAAATITLAAGATATISCPLGGGATSFAVLAGTGTLTLSGNNTWTGWTWIQTGTVSVNRLENLSTASPLGAPTTAANGTIYWGAAGGTSTLIYTGTGHSTDRKLSMDGGGGGGIIDQSGASGLLKFTGAVAPEAAGNYTLTLKGSAGGTGEIGGVISKGTGTSIAIVKDGTGTWTLSGANTYAGATTINAGTLELGVSSTVNTAGPLGTTAAGTTVASGASLDLNGFSLTAAATEALSISGTGVGGLGALTNSSTTASTYIGVITFVAAASVVGNGSTTGTIAITGTPVSSAIAITLGGSAGGSIGTVIAGARALTKEGTGTWTLSGANTFTGGVNLDAGTLNINNATALGTVAGTFVIADGTTINNTTAGSITVSANNPMTWNGNFTFTGTQALNLGTGNVAMGSSLRTVTVSGSTLTVGGTISGTGGLTKEGAGALTLGAVLANNWTGTTTINGGTLTTGTQNGGDYYQSASWVVNSGGTLVSGSNNILVNTAIVTVNTGGTWNTNSKQETFAYLVGGGNITNMSFAGTAMTLDLGTTGSGSDFSGAISGSGNLRLRGANTGGTTSTQIFSGPNAYTGTTAIEGGILNIRHATALGTTAAGTSVTAGAALQIQNGITVGAEALTLNGTGISTDGALRNISGTNVWQGTVTLGSAARINSDAGSLTFNTAANSITATNFALTLGGAAGGTVGGTITTGTGTLTKDGAGTWTLSGANTYTGTTTVSAGTLIAGSNAPSGAAGAFGNAASAIILGDAATTTNNSSPSLLTGGAFTIGRAVTVANQATSGTYTIGGNTDNNSTFSGAVTINQPLSVTQVATTTTNTLSITGGITTGNAGTKNLTFNNAGAVTVSTTAITPGTGDIAVVKQNSGTLTMNVANTYTGGSTLTAGILELKNTAGLGAAGQAIALNGGTLDFDTDATVNAYNTTVGGTVTIESDRATSGAGITHILGTLSIGAQTLTVNKGINVASGTAAVSFGNLTLTGAATFNTGTADLLMTGSAAGNFKLTKSGAGTLQKTTAGWTLANDFEITAGIYDANAQTTTVTGLATVSGGEYKANTASQTFNGGLTISGGTFTGLSGTAGNVTTTNLTLSSGTLSAPGSSGTFNVSGNWTNNGGTFTHNSGTVTLNGAAQAIGGSSVTSFNSLTLGGTDAKTASIGVNVSGALTVNKPLTMSGSTVLTMLNGASQPTFSGLTEITGTMTWQAYNAAAYTFHNAQTIVTFTGADGARTFTLTPTPDTYPTFSAVLAGHTVKRKFIVSHSGWSTGTATLQLAYLQAEASTLGVTESRLRDFQVDFALGNNLTGVLTRSTSGPAAFGYLSYGGLPVATPAAGEIGLDDRFGTFRSIASAAWNVATTWDQNDIPSTWDYAIVDDDFPVTIPDAYTASALKVTINLDATGLTVGAGASGVLNVGTGGLTNSSAGTGLTVSPGAIVTITSGTLTNGGSITNNGTVTVQ